MISSNKNQQENKNDPGLAEVGTGLAQCFFAAIFPGVDMFWEAAEVGSAIYTDRVDTAVKRTNGQEGAYALGVKNSLGSTFCRAQASLSELANNDNFLPFWKREPGYGYAIGA